MARAIWIPVPAGVRASVTIDLPTSQIGPFLRAKISSFKWNHLRRRYLFEIFSLSG
jgi:hypothetical protein